MVKRGGPKRDDEALKPGGVEKDTSKGNPVSMPRGGSNPMALGDLHAQAPDASLIEAFSPDYQTPKVEPSRQEGKAIGVIKKLPLETPNSSTRNYSNTCAGRNSLVHSRI